MSARTLADHTNKVMGRTPANLLIKNVNIFDVVTGETITSDIAINTENGRILDYDTGFEADEVIDATGLYAVPGFIDTHVHVESSMITPLEFDRCVLPHGTTTAICDPHEMSNVLGVEALEYFIKSSECTLMDLIVQLSSCVPATPLETSGATLNAADLVKLREHFNVLGLAEFMNIGGVLGNDPEALEKLAAFEGWHVDGHMPAGVSGRMMAAMAGCGIYNCHETTDIEHGREKLRKGLHLLIREGTVCKDLETLTPLINSVTAPFISFCTDDRNPLDIAEEGHVDHLIRKAIAGGADVLSTYRAATISAATGFGLHKDTNKQAKRGKIAPGWKADIVLLKDLKTCDIHSVIKDGYEITPESFTARPRVKPVGYNSIKLKNILPEDFSLKRDKTTLPVIELIKDSVVTASSEQTLPVNSKGEMIADPANDLLKIAVLERHGKTGNIARWFVKGFGFKEGAIASSIGHDSHNITVVGATDEDMALAVNRLKEIGGGFAVARNGVIEGEIALPVAGIMSDKPLEEVKTELQALRDATDKLGASVDEPLMHMIFLPLCVIPAMKLTDFGPVKFDPANGDQAPVLVEDQRRAKLTP